MFRIIVFLNFIQTLFASFCGEGFMAYGLSLSFGGQFTLGCAQPTCLKFPIIESPTFAFVNGVKDGFVNLPLINERAFINDRAVCETTFDSSNCTAEDQWLAGIAPISNLSNVTTLSLRCCKHWALKSGKFQKVVTIKNGEMYSGGDIYDSEEEEVLAFDYITNIKKFDTNNGTLVEIIVNRLPCNLEADKNSEGLSKNKVRIHQAPLVETGDYPAVDYDSIKVENDEASTAVPEELATESGIESGSDVTVAQSYSEGGGEKYNLDLSPPEVAPEAPPAPEYQTLSPNVETQTLPSIVTPEIPQPQNNVEQPQTQIQQNVQSQGSSYAQSGSQNQQQSSYVQPPPQSANPSYQAPFYQMQSMFSSPFMSQVQNQIYPQSSGVQQSYQSSGSNGYYPVAQQSAGGSGCCGGMMCFTGDTLVTSMNGTKIRMDELTVNDWVLTGGENQIGYSKINSWLHRKPKLVTEFIKFTLENGIELKMTKKHYIFKSDCLELSSPVKVEKAIQNMVYAENVTINDCLFVISPKKKLMKTRISKIEIIKEKGIYSPMTNNGNIIVNDVFASCFNIVQNDVVQITFPTIIKKVSNHLSKILYYFIGFSFGDYHSYQLQKEIELIPGLSGLVEIVKVIVPKK
uniref:Uncharacterized protein n=1 Tax=Panagrolaimus davidi TaxID=227884 RepID=A0A914QR55_9BILA